MNWLRRSCCILLASQVACSYQPTVTLDDASRASVGRVAILASHEPPLLAFEGFVHGKGEGAAAGGAAAFAACAGGLRGGCSGALCGPVAVLWLGVCGAAGVVGGIAGAVTAPVAGAATAAEGTLAAALSTATIQESLRDRLIALAPAARVDVQPLGVDREAALVESGDFRGLTDRVDTVLIAGLTEAGTAATVGGSLTLSVAARVRVVRARDNVELLAASYRFQGGSHDLETWAENQAALLRTSLADAYEGLAAHVVDSVFLLYPFPDRHVHSAGFLASAFGLAPIDPRTRGQLSGDRLFGSRFEWTTVASRRPALRWEAFPRAGDRTAAPDDMTRVRNVRYDLVIARERDGAPAEVVYRRSRLPRPTHWLESALPGRAGFFWSVRARFELDGRERVTEWSATAPDTGESFVAPSRWAYRFRTP